MQTPEEFKNKCVAIVGSIAEIDMDQAWGKITKDQAWDKVHNILKKSVE